MYKVDPASSLCTSSPHAIPLLVTSSPSPRSSRPPSGSAIEFPPHSTAVCLARHPFILADDFVMVSPPGLEDSLRGFDRRLDYPIDFSIVTVPLCHPVDSPVAPLVPPTTVSLPSAIGRCSIRLRVFARLLAVVRLLRLACRPANPLPAVYPLDSWTHPPVARAPIALAMDLLPDVFGDLVDRPGSAGRLVIHPDAANTHRRSADDRDTSSGGLVVARAPARCIPSSVADVAGWRLSATVLIRESTASVFLESCGEV